MAVSARRAAQGDRRPWGPIAFLRDAVKELTLVQWPTLPELYRYTMIVLAVVVVFSVFIFVVDSGLSQLVAKYVIGNGLTGSK